MVNENAFERLSLPISEMSEEFILFALIRLRAAQNSLIQDPDAISDTRPILAALQSRYVRFIRGVESWLDEELARSYLRGIETGNATGGSRSVTAGAFSTVGLLVPNLPSQPISPTAAKILKDYPNHHTMYGVFRQAADNALESTRVPIIRQQEGRLREMAIRAGETNYREADIFTRRQMSQDLMRQYADEGITGIRYSNGRTVQLDSYAEMTARSQTKNAFNQANWNRLQEYGMDLTVISVHYPCSPLCEPHQGKVFSISGSSDQYPSLDSAISDGLFHANCKHSSSGYVPGSKAPKTDTGKRENKEMYDAQVKQRQIERNIKSWKRREATAVDPAEQAKAKAKVSEWQGRQREHIQSNEYLRRNYSREQI